MDPPNWACKYTCSSISTLYSVTNLPQTGTQWKAGTQRKQTTFNDWEQNLERGCSQELKIIEEGRTPPNNMTQKEVPQQKKRPEKGRINNFYQRQLFTINTKLNIVSKFVNYHKNEKHWSASYRYSNFLM